MAATAEKVNPDFIISVVGGSRDPWQPTRCVLELTSTPCYFLLRETTFTVGEASSVV